MQAPNPTRPGDPPGGIGSRSPAAVHTLPEFSPLPELLHLTPNAITPSLFRGRFPAPARLPFESNVPLAHTFHSAISLIQCSYIRKWNYNDHPGRKKVGCIVPAG